MARARATATEWRKIGPSEATELLKANAVNRRLRPRTVECYAEDMREGLWRESGETIKLSRTGRLLDGQHRLTAITEADVTLELLVVTGLPDEAQQLMDQGAARTAHDVLSMEGFSNANLTAAVARWVLLGGVPGPHLEQALKTKASTVRILKTAKENPDIAVAAGKHSGFKNHILGSPTALCYSWLYMHRIDVVDCDAFYCGMVDLSFKALHDPRKAVLRTLQRMDREGIGTASKDKAMATVSVLTRAWNAWRAGEQMQAINMRGKDGKIIPPVTPI